MNWKVSLVWPEPRTVSNQSSDTIQGNFPPLNFGMWITRNIINLGREVIVKFQVLELYSTPTDSVSTDGHLPF